MNFKILPVLRKEQPDKNGFCQIYLYVYNPKLIAKKPVGEKILPEFWNAEDRAVKKKHKLAVLINSKIEKLMSEIKTDILREELADTNKEINVKSLLNKEKIKAKEAVCFYEFAERQTKEKDYSEETRRTYRMMLSKFKRYQENIKINDINFQWLQSFEAYLRNDLGNKNNTIWSNFKFINTIVNDAIKAKIITETPFKEFKRQRYRQTGRTYLTADERAIIENFANNATEALPYDRQLKTAANYFLFMCYTGLRISDAFQFDPSLHIINNERIFMTSQKTGQQINLYLTEKIRYFVDYIRLNKIVGTHAAFNYSLQNVVAKLGIKKNITAHVARHTFGSTLVDLGVDMKVAQGLLAHGSIESTKVYYHVKSTNLDDAMKKFNGTPQMKVLVSNEDLEIQELEKKIAELRLKKAV
jgi:integrase/recombinase XerD